MASSDSEQTPSTPLSPVPEFNRVASINGHEDGSDMQLPAFDEQDYSSHRNVYVGVHMPYSAHRHKKHHHHHRRHKRKIRVEGGQSSEVIVEELNDVHLPAACPKTPVDPCDRVKFILGDLGDDTTDQETIHPVFTELEELHYDEHAHRMEWKETARWVKFEEDVEERGEKWSKPHVATLSLHSLFDLRAYLMKGTFLFDLAASNLAQISDMVVDKLVLDGHLEEERREKVKDALLQRHKHGHHSKDNDKSRFPHIKSIGEFTRHNSAPTNMEKPSSLGIFSRFTSRQNSQTSHDNSGLHLQVPDSSRRGSIGGNSSDRVSNGEGEDHKDHKEHHPKYDEHFMKKLPPGSEASNVLVGEVDFLSHTIIAFVRLADAVLLGDLTEVPIPTRFLFILLGPKGSHKRYHEIGRAIATLMADDVFHEVAYKARNLEDLLAGLDEFLDKVTVLPPGEWDPEIRLEPPSQIPSQQDRLKDGSKEGNGNSKDEHSQNVECTVIPFSGLWRDIKRRYPLYLTDFRDAIWDTSRNKCSLVAFLSTVAAIVFIYFANIAPAITFGQVLSEKTKGNMGAVEMILSVSVGNIVYALTAGQPLVVLGGTGPTLIFEDIVFGITESQGIPYLEFRLWIGLWTGLLMVLLVVFNVSIIVRLFTRFTAEIFSTLISFIFIYEALEKVWLAHLSFPYDVYIWFPFARRNCSCFEFDTEGDLEEYNRTMSTNGVNFTDLGSIWTNMSICNGSEPLQQITGDPACVGDFKHNVFFFTIILFFGTFFVAYYLKKFKETPFFPSVVRRVISDFGVMVSVIIWVLVNYFANVQGVPSLQVPRIVEEGLYTNTSVRQSLILNPLGNGLPHWAPIAAFIPALLATILLFMDQQITALVINRKDNKLKKGPGYHLDLLIVAGIIVVFSFLGLPWVVGATVRSIAHVQSLFLFSAHTAPGERPKFLGVREQRVTLLCMAVLLGVSVLLYQALELLPLAVLYGLFLYIGVASLKGVQLVQRMLIVFMPDKYKPDEPYVRNIPNRRLHLYTLVQIIMLVLLCIFKVVREISIIFPVMVLLLVGGRWLVGWCFPKGDLDILDEPIPESLYCKRRQRDYDIEKGSLEEEEVSSEAKESEEAPPQQQQQQSIEHVNISQEVDRCQLWKHMMHKLDAEPTSGAKSQVRNRGSEQRPGYNVKTNLNKKFDEVEQQKRDEEDERAGLLYQSTTV